MKNKKILYLGLDPKRYPHTGELVHLPIIRLVPRPFKGLVETTFAQLGSFSHVILSSRLGAWLFTKYAARTGQHVHNKTYITVGTATSQILEKKGIGVDHTAFLQTGEGIVHVLQGLELQTAHLFFPRSALSRDVIPRYCAEQQILLTTLDLYDTVPSGIPLPDLTGFDQIVFTSPSTVHAFFAYGKEPPREICWPIGPITAKALDTYLPGRRM